MLENRQRLLIHISQLPTRNEYELLIKCVLHNPSLRYLKYLMSRVLYMRERERMRKEM